MPWVTYKRELPNGTYETVRVWVAPKKKKRRLRTSNNAAMAAERRRQRERNAALARQRAAKSSAQKAASLAARLAQQRAERERQRAIVAARRRAYEELMRRQHEITRNAGVIRDQQRHRQQPAPPPSGPARDALTEARNRQSRYEAERAAAKAAADARIKRQNAADARRWEDKYAAYERAETIRKFKAGQAASARELEKQLERERQRALKTGAAQTEYLAELQKRYEQHAKAIYDRYERLVARINAALKKGNIKAARNLYYGKDFARTQKEFGYLFGKGKNPLRDGSYSKFYKGYQDIALAQRNWWKNQMRASLQSQLQDVRRHRGDDKLAGYLQAQLDAFNGKTGVIDTVDKNGRRIQRNRTLEEELDYQRAKLITEQQRLAVERGRMEQQRKVDMIRHGMTEYNGQIVKRRDVDLIKASEDLVKTDYAGVIPGFKKSEDLQGFADKLVNKWATQNPPPPGSTGHGHGGAAYAEWLKQKADYEKRVYDFFGSKPPDWWERVLQTPGLSHGMAILSGGVSAIGGLARVGSAFASDYSTVGGVTPGITDVPESVKRAADRAAATTPERGKGVVRSRYINEWLKTPEGQRWIKEEEQRRREQSSVEDKEFAETFYGSFEKHDVGAKLQSLIDYGSQPFESGSANLLFQLLLDPTNAIPLKATTYLARGKYAFEAAQGAKGLTAPTAKAAAFAKKFLAVDEGTLELRRAISAVEKRLEKEGTSVERVVDEFRAHVAGIEDKAKLKSEVNTFMRKIGLDPRTINEAQLFNIIEHLATKKADDLGIPHLTQIDEYNTSTKATIAAHEAEERAAEQARKLDASRVKSSHERRVERGQAARERLAIKRESQEAVLTTKSAQVSAPEAGAAPGARVTRPEPARNPNVSGASDNRVAARETKKVSNAVRAKRPHPRYDAADEFYQVDPLGNRLPLDFTPDEDYRKLVTAAKAGDGDAREQLINRSRYERNRFRMEQEDLPLTTRRRDVRFQPTKFDIAERAGTVGDDVATERLLYDRKLIRDLKRRAAAGGSDENIRAYVRPLQNSKQKPIIDVDIDRLRTAEDEFGDLRSQQTEVIPIGDEILLAREDSLRGVKDLYETFSHDSTKYYDGLSGVDLTTITKKDFARRLFKLGKDTSLATFRDGGQFVFEVFHQLRLAKDWDKLREFSDLVTTGILNGAEDNLLAWMWKTMEERSVLPYSMHINDIRLGFYAAAEAWGVHPELAFSTIPSGYFARRPPITFGLTAKLQGLVDNASPLFHVAEKGYTKELAKDEVTRIFLGEAGEPTRVLHYVAERFGDFVKGGEVAVRMKDELTHALALAMGPEVLADAILKQPDAIAHRLLDLSDRRGVPVVELIERELSDKVRKWGRTPERPRPEYQDFRDAVLQAYRAGDLPDIPPRAHLMILLHDLQTNPRAYIGSLRRYRNYMAKIGGQDWEDAKALIHDLYEGEILSDISRVAAEGLGRPAYRDAFTGEAAPHAQRSRVALWKEFEFMPSDKRLSEYAAQRAAKNDALEREFAQQRERDSWLKDETETPMADYMGHVDTSNFEANVRSLVVDLRAGKKVEAALDGTIRNFMYKMLDNAKGNMDQTTLDALRDAVEAMAKFPEAKKALLRVQDELGFVRLDTLLRSAVKPLVDEEVALLRELKLITESGGAIRKGMEKRAAQVNLEIERIRIARRVAGGGGQTSRINLDALREAESPTPVAPAETASRSVAGQLYDHIFKMDESEWLAFEKQRANRVLTNPRASVGRKSLARSHIRDIEAAEFAIKVEKRRGVYVPWRERAAFRERVLRLHGQAAEELIAPKMVSPFVLSAGDAVVEQARTYWRLLKTAAPTDVPSPIKSIVHNGETLDYVPKGVWDEIEQRVADAVAGARGYRADTRTRARHVGRRDESHRPMGRLSDNDPIVSEAKSRALLQYARDTGTRISVDAYDAVRSVVWKGYVQDRTARWLLARSERIVERTGADLEKTFLALRAKEAKLEARRQLGGLAYRDMFGQDPDIIMREFMQRYSNDAVLRQFIPELSPFQRKTLEEHVKSLSGLDGLDERIGVFLQSANMPPLHNRELTRDFLTRIGAWSPRTADDFVQGAKSWSVWEEADYWKVNYGEIPEWTDPRALATDFEVIFHDQSMYFLQMKAWGIFNRSQELKLRLDGKTAEEIERAVLEGDETLGLKGRRELALQRKYVIERYGELVSKDGLSLDTMPWLMTPDEYRRYLTKTTSKNLPEGLIQTAKELDEVEAMIEKAMGPVWEKYIVPKAAEGAVTHHDIFRVAAEVQAQLLANPKWARRHRDILGNILNAWSWFIRALVFSNPSFLVTNAIDAPIKTMYYRFTRRGLFDSALAGKYGDGARALTPQSLGMDATSAMYRVKQASARSRLLHPRGLSTTERAVDRALAAVDGVGHQLLPHLAGEVELSMRMHLARGMYPQVYGEALKRLKNADLAEAFTRDFIKKEVLRMWPTAGSGPIEHLWNRIAPFSSYAVRNKILFVGEAVGHPALINYVNRIGAYIEEQNLKDWERNHPGMEMPEHLRRRIQLPWAPGYYLDLSTFSDAARGLRPIFETSKQMSILDYTATWVRGVNPGAQAIIYSLFNAFNIGQRQMWRAKMSNGFPTGEYELVTVGWLEPWSNKEAELGSGFWFSEAFRKGQELGADSWTIGEVSQMAGMVFLFNGIATYDKGSTLASYYFTLRAKDPKAAAAWLLNTEEGQYVQDWLTEQSAKPHEVMDRLRDIARAGKDPAPWFHDQTPEFQQKVKDGRELIKRIRASFAAELATMTPGTAEYREMKARMYIAINNVYLNTPELMMANIFGKTASEWSQQLEDWQTDKLMDDFMELNAQRPSRAKYEDSKAYNKAVAEWNHSKQVYLQQYPQVAERLAAGRDEVGKLRDEVEKEWNKIFNRISVRNEQIDAAKAIIDRAGRESAQGARSQELLDRLYLANELDFSLLERDYAATYFSDDDFNKLPPGMVGPPTLKGNVLKRATVLLDFDRLRYEKAVREGRGAQFLADLKYNQALHDAILKAKGGDVFGKFDPAKFVAAIKSNPTLMRDYFRKNPGKKEQWAKTDAYIKNISMWGKLVGAGRWDEANRVWDNLPQWVKDEYFSRHPGSKMRREKAQVSSQYMGFMQHWVGLFEAGKKDAAMDYFRSLPGWAKERYYAAHPGQRAKFELDNRMAGLLRDYFSRDKAGKTALLRLHPELAKFLADNGTSKEAQEMTLLAAYRAIPKDEPWLRRVFREQHPEIFSQEAIGKKKLAAVFDTLSHHPDLLPDFEEWVKVIFATYEDMLKYTPRPLSTYITSERKVPRRKYYQNMSAEETSRLLI
jgi:hypothetical protein